jgi:molybdenum cofactor cytidylyltransferase
VRFGAFPLDKAHGAILAHSMGLPGGAKLRKGHELTYDDLAALKAAGFSEVIAARVEAGDMHEDPAAAAIAAALACPTMTVSAPFTGRVNLFAGAAGVLRVDAAKIAAVNAIDESVTVATLPDWSRVAPRQMAATVKIIPYAAPRAAVEAAVAAARGAMTAHPFRLRSAALILTETPGTRASVTEKGAEAVRVRLAALGIVDIAERRTPHEAAPLAQALRDAPGEVALILTGSATSDRADVGPAAVEAAGGLIERFGMPVDPGNLLFLGIQAGRPVIGLPGCARSPKLNGADWVLERVVAGLSVTSTDIAAMGLGGLLKEIPSRPEPRAGGARAPRKPFVSAVLLAAGSSSRMRGADKLIETVDGAPQIARAARALCDSRADETLVVLGPGQDARRAALSGMGLRVVENPAAAEGMASSIRAAIAALSPEADAVLVALADMPEIAPEHLDRVIAAFDPEEGRAIVRAADAAGRPGHPVLFGRRFFETLARLKGDEGARAILADHPELVIAVTTPGAAATIDLDTPEAWDAWRAGRSAAGDAQGLAAPASGEADRVGLDRGD